MPPSYIKNGKNITSAIAIGRKKARYVYFLLSSRLSGSRDAFKAFKAANAGTELKRMMDWKKQVRAQLADLYENQIAPLINE